MDMGLDGNRVSGHGEAAGVIIGGHHRLPFLIADFFRDTVGDLPAVGLGSLTRGQGDFLPRFAEILPLMRDQNAFAGNGAVLQLQEAPDPNGGVICISVEIIAEKIDGAGALQTATDIDTYVLRNRQRGSLGNGQRFLIKNIKSTPEGGIAIDRGIAVHADDAVGDGSTLGQHGGSDRGISDGNDAGGAIHRHADAVSGASPRLYTTAVNGDVAAGFLGIAADGSMRPTIALDDEPPGMSVLALNFQGIAPGHTDAIPSSEGAAICQDQLGRPRNFGTVRKCGLAGNQIGAGESNARISSGEGRDQHALSVLTPHRAAGAAAAVAEGMGLVLPAQGNPAVGADRAVGALIHILIGDLAGAIMALIAAGYLHLLRVSKAVSRRGTEDGRFCLPIHHIGHHPLGHRRER